MSYQELLDWNWTAPRDRAARLVQGLDEVPVAIPHVEPSDTTATLEPTDTTAPTAILCVTSHSGFGLHLIGTVCRLFPGYFPNFIFVSTASELDLERYVAWARANALRADCRAAHGSEVIPALYETCRQLLCEYPRGVVIIGKAIFREREYPWSAYSSMASTLERRLLFDDIQTLVLPITVPDSQKT